ncbi:tail fiber domain-containing protein [Aeromonas veronii]|uniref:tail fiber domain-containing protein n=1 Tax=Aeromonas veronii TaxID=654 RepID=UPI00191D3398|nr:tail fiber domain-containing protein [Aeromonas veronii]MBL0492795.1 tail fiber domain-containing protein [Aeromonas veronii]
MIQIYGVMTDPAGKSVPGAIIELRSLTTTSEVLMGSVLTFKCDTAGRYLFPLAVGAYDVYAQNDQCGDMDYLGTGVVVSQGADGPLNSILVDSGISLTPPLLDRAVDAMQRAESAAEATGRDRIQTGNDVSAAQRASLLAAEQASAALASANTADSKAGEAATSATAATASATQALQWAENPLDVAVVPDKYSALHHAAKASDSATAATVSASASGASAATAAAQAANASESAATATTKASDAAASAGTATIQANAALDAKVAAAASEAHALTHASNADSAAQASERAKVVTIEHAGRVTTLAQQVSADRADVQTKSAEVATHAATVAVQSSEVSTNAASVAQSKVAVQGMRDVVVAKTAEALAAADTASDKASQAAQDQAAAATSAQQAGMAKILAEAWAQNPEGSDINGRPGEFSALHWALQAQKWAQAITSQLVWAGPWNASAGAPIAPAPNQGIPFYRISHSGVIASESYVVGDYLHWDPASRSWFKIDGTDAVISINGMTGAVVLSAADVGARPASWVPGWADIANKPVTMPPSEHTHAWSQLSNIPVYATRWPTIAEIDAAAASHTHAWSQLTGIPAYAARWPAWGEVTGKPEFAAISHRHTWGQIDQVPVTASRWPSYSEVTDKPDFAPASHTHPYMADGGSYGTLYLSNWFRSTGNTGWYSQTHGGGIYMEDATWVRTYGGKKFHVANGEGDAINTTGGVYATGNGNFNDVYIRSDRRLKSNITPITDALAKVKLLTGNLYDKAGQREAGLIAQELAEAQPESVFLNMDGTLSIAHAGVLALLVEAVKALDEKLEVFRGGAQ